MTIHELEKQVACASRWSVEQEGIAAAKAAKRERRYDLAWQILDRTDLAEGSDKTAWRWQQLALCKSQDRDIPTDARHEAALEILEQHLDLSRTQNRETLGIAGGICKRWWRENGQRIHLQRAMAFYYRGYQSPEGNDNGYNGINAAFLLELLALQELEIGMPADSPFVVERLQLADKIRTDISRMSLTAEYSDWWPYATVAEAAIGLGNMTLAAAALAKVMAEVPANEKEVAMRQLANVAHNRARRTGDDQYRAQVETMLSAAFKIPVEAVQSAMAGKVGLALSGGGFRASLFHIGVLARLAETGVLQHVEVISCVSGGSIIGAYYYLALKKVLSTKNDADPIDYVQIVKDVEEKFLTAVQHNVRTRLAVSPRGNWKMFWDADYSRTERAAELFEELFYGPLMNAKPPLHLSDLKIAPPDEARDAKPRDYNWRRRTKVPIVVLNATTLNTGHQFQFTATYLGEPPQRTTGIDAIERWRRLYESEVPEEHRRIRLGKAVGASACVPGLFTPIVIRNLYEDRVAQLVDGGVHDNQGVATLLAEECNVLLVSDASGQMTAVESPGTDIVPVVLRSDEILQARLREAQLVDLHARRASGTLQGLMFIHLTKDLDQRTVTTANATNKPQPPNPRTVTTSYGVRKDIQQLLAETRTDLDSFSDVEAFALMTSGYLMTEGTATHKYLPTLIDDGPPQARGDWRFLKIADALGGGRDAEHVAALLADSRHRAGRVWNQAPRLKRIRRAFNVMTFASSRRKRTGKSLQERAIGGLTILGTGLAWLHVRFFDKAFLKIGKWPRRTV